MTFSWRLGTLCFWAASDIHLLNGDKVRVLVPSNFGLSQNVWSCGKQFTGVFGTGENTQFLHLFVLFLFFESKGKWIRTKVLYSIPSFNYNLIQYKRTSFLSAIFNAYGSRHGICSLYLWLGCSVLMYLPPVQLGLPFQATVKPAGHHLYAICWNEIYIFGIRLLSSVILHWGDFVGGLQ